MKRNVILYMLYNNQASLGSILENLQKQEGENEDEQSEYRYQQMLTGSLNVVKDPRYEEDDLFMTIEKGAELCGVEIRQVSPEIGEGVFSLSKLRAGDVLCNVTGRWVRRDMTRLKCNNKVEYIVPGNPTPLPA